MDYRSLAYSALAWVRIGMSGSASFQIVSQQKHNLLTSDFKLYYAKFI